VNKILEDKLGREPTPSEIAHELDVETSEINTLRNMSYEYVSLDANMGDKDEGSFFVMVEDKTTESPMKKVEEESLKEAIQTVISTLSQNEQEILKLRFGLGEEEPMSLQQIGKKFGLSKERIRQIEKKALRRLRHPSRSMKLQVFMSESDS
jgi:RNA polymerase primary sigma factor